MNRKVLLKDQRSMASHHLPRNRLGTQYRWRYHFFEVVIICGFLAIGLRLWDLQVRQNDQLSEKAVKQQETTVDLLARRGGIYDRHGADLALSTPVQSIGVFTDRIENKALFSKELAKALHLDESEVLSKLNNGGFQWVKRLVTLTEEDRVRRLDRTYLHFETESKRYYPHGPVAAHVLGTVSMDHHGQTGLEQKFEKQIKGQPGYGVMHYDARRRLYGRKIIQNSVPGHDLILNVDLDLQALAHLELEKAIKDSDSEAGTVVLMHPETGEILALSSWPRYDPNNLSRTPQELENMLNFAVSHMVEPGSTFKVLTAAAALEEGLVQTDELIDCQMGGIWVNRRMIRDHRPHGLLTMPQILVKSSNVGIIKIGQRIEKETFYSYIKKFGFGQRTGVALPNETTGLVRSVNRWSESSHASLAMGQEIGVTAFQMAQLFSTIANGGILVKPRIVQAMRDPDGNVSEMETEAGTRVISADTAVTLKAILEQVVAGGTGTLAQIPGYFVAGKTGTAQMVNPKTGKYVNGPYMASFCGFAPVNNPQLVGVVMLYNPRGEQYYGGQIAAPLFSSVVRRALRHLDVSPARPKAPGRKQAFRDPDIMLADYVPNHASDLWNSLSSQPLIEANSLTKTGLASIGNSTSPVNPQSEDEMLQIRVLGQAVPDIRGLTMREAFVLAAELGIEIAPRGHGLATAQSPAANDHLMEGQVLHVDFSLSQEAEASAGQRN